MRAAVEFERLEEAALRQPGAVRRHAGIKFQCPGCAAEGHDRHRDNAILFLDGTWGCAVAADTPRGREHWEAIGRALGALGRPSSNGAGAGAPGAIWDSALSVPELLAEADAEVVYLEPRLLVRGAITELFAPRGLGKTQVAYAVGLRLAREGQRVLLVDRDNPRHEVKRRLRAWGGVDATRFRFIGRERAPALTDAAAWQAFPLDTYDVVIIDSIDAATEGVGEGDSAKPAKALAPILDLARRADGPAILVLGNVVKSGAHSRGCGVLEDRADIVYEVRDATDLRPTGTRDWWHELPPASVGAWAERASRRKRRPTYRLAFIPTKFRLGEEPEPFCFEVDHRTTPWRLLDVTADLIAAGRAAAEQAAAERARQLDQAVQALLQEIARRGDQAMTLGEAEALLRGYGLTQKGARSLLRDGSEGRWILRPEGRKVVVVSPDDRISRNATTRTRTP